MLKLKYWTVISFVLLSFTSTCVLGQNLSKQSILKIDSLLMQYALGNAPGYSIAVIKDKRTVYERYEGFSDLERKQLTTKFTNYRLASVTKQFTALAILQLNQRKKLDIDDDIQKYLPSLPAYAKSIKIRHLLNHVSGLVDYENLNAGYKEPVTDVDVLKLLSAQDTLRFTPGSKYEYSNSGYSLLASIIEKVSGQAYPNYIYSNIFKPLKMDQSTFNIRGWEIPNRAYGYSKKGNAFEKTDQSSTSYVLGDGGIYSSVEDMIKWENALMKGTLIKESPLQQASLFSFDLDANNKYACGWRITNKHNVQIYNHTGSSRGFLTYHIFVPSKNLGVIFLTNRTGTDL
jgi:CubicO group peptidase (beta-lactamase class C family)